MDCACGCGQEIPARHLFRYRPPYVLRGHRMPTPPCKCGCGEPVKWTVNSRYSHVEYVQGHDKRAKVEPRLCECGCGSTTTIWHGRAKRYINGHQQRGKHWGAGRHISPAGYVMILMPKHPQAQKGYVAEHRWVMEQKVGRLLRPDEPVHHINRVKTDNRLENLELLDQHEHGRHHGLPKGHRFTPEQRAALSERMRVWWAKRKATIARRRT